VLSVALFDYDDVLGERVLEEYEAESARWAERGKVRRETVASIPAGEAVDVQRASSVLRYPHEVTHVAIVAWVCAARRRRPSARRRAGARDARELCVIAVRVRGQAGRPGVAGLPHAARRGDDRRLARRSVDGRHLDPGRRAAPGVVGFRNSHAEALAARRLARLSQHRAGSVRRWGSVAVLGLLSTDVEGAREFVSPELGPLDADDAIARLRARSRSPSARSGDSNSSPRCCCAT
jgi:hypothetical protein